MAFGEIFKCGVTFEKFFFLLEVGLLRIFFLCLKKRLWEFFFSLFCGSCLEGHYVGLSLQY